MHTGVGHYNGDHANDAMNWNATSNVGLMFDYGGNSKYDLYYTL